MTDKEINASIEKLTNEFKTQVSEHFKLTNATVKLKKLDFTIEQTKIDNIEALNHGVNTFTLSCRINSQGQVVCTESI